MEGDIARVEQEEYRERGGCIRSNEVIAGEDGERRRGGGGMGEEKRATWWSAEARVWLGGSALVGGSLATLNFEVLQNGT